MPPGEKRDAARAPGPTCPQSWYLVAASADVRPERILATEVGGQELVVYRGSGDGQARVMAAHCAHLGAHLKHGRVVGDGVRCALHHRVFDGTGTCRMAGMGGATQELRQPAFRVLERYGGVWAFLGEAEAFEFPVPALAQSGAVATRLIAPRPFPISWKALIANGCDIDHLQTVHHRRLRAEPELLRPAPHRLEVAYEASVIGSGLSDRVMRRLAGDRVRARISCLGGSLMLVESTLGSRRSFLMLSMVPSAGGTTIRGVAGVPAGPGAWGLLKAGLAAWLFTAFLERDVEFLDGLALHRPPGEATLGDRFMNRVFDYLEGVPLFQGHRGWTAA